MDRIGPRVIEAVVVGAGALRLATEHAAPNAWTTLPATPELARTHAEVSTPTEPPTGAEPY